MKLFQTTAPHHNLFTGYDADYVAVNHVLYRHPLLVMPTELIPWDVSNFDALNEAAFEHLLTYRPEVVILGTGSALRFPHPSLSRALTAQQIGVEVMDTQAACRTYNILMSEDRRVLAALLV